MFCRILSPIFARSKKFNRKLQELKDLIGSIRLKSDDNLIEIINIKMANLNEEMKAGYVLA